MKATKNEYKFSLLLILPSIILVAIFVYGFVGNTVYTSLTDWGQGAALMDNPEKNFIGLKNYKELFTGFIWDRFRQDLVNAIFYWIFILFFSLLIGFGLAVLLDHYPKGENFFRTLFLYPFALSFVVTGTIWRWIFAPNGGINVIPTFFGLPKIEFLWLSERGSVLNFNWQNLPLLISILFVLTFSYLSWLAWRKKEKIKFFIFASISFLFFLNITLFNWILPPILPRKEIHGFNLATIGVIIAAVWQYSGYTMALYLAGLRGLPISLYEASKIDGANNFTYYFKIAIPNLWPITLSAMIVISHISLKIFSLIFAMAGTDNASTGHPSVLMYLTTFRANNFAMGASIAVMLFFLASLFIIPYLIYLYNQRKI